MFSHNKLVTLFVCFYGVRETFEKNEPSCSSRIYCQGELLRTVQTARIFPDSKTFVDMKLRFPEDVVLQNFEVRQPRNKEDISRFVSDNFASGDELTVWEPPDFDPDPPFLKTITVPKYRRFAKELVQLWRNFSRIVKPQVFDHPELYSIIPVRNGFIAPGGRFKEFYYWDSYWIMKGLLASGMHRTVRGMIENFLSIVDRYGFIPNGGRIYYLNRSQPPLLTMMVNDYLEVTNDYEWLEQNFDLIQNELKYWLRTRNVTVAYEGVNHTLCRYFVDSPSPRPESYREDVETCLPRHNVKCYKDIKSGAESGWDFSSRWFFNGNLSSIRTTKVIPVDLNAILARSFKLVANFANIIGDTGAEIFWTKKQNAWKTSIETILFDPEEGVWFDVDVPTLKKRRGFYPSNLSPLWCRLYDDIELGDKAVEYLAAEGILTFPAGIPTSLLNNGQQWDLPNAWPPLQSMVILGLKWSGSEAALNVARNLARRWIDNNLLIYDQTGLMYEKYNAQVVGQAGGGGEYPVQTGFGWSNGVIFELIQNFFTSTSYF